MIRIHNIKVPLGKTQYRKILSQVLNVREKQLKSIHLVKQSVDARRNHIHFICSFDFEIDNEDDFLLRHPELKKIEPYQYHFYPKNDKRVVVVGSGPAGLFCAYVLSKVGQQVTVIERGQAIEQRVVDVDQLMEKGILTTQSNIAFGEGGAGTFSDGKLTTGIKNERLQYVIETFIKHGAPKDILYVSKPHIGTDYLRKVIVDMRNEMITNGVCFMFDTQFIDFEDCQTYKKVNVLHNQKIQTLETDALVLAIGHSARDTYELLYKKGLLLEQKAFAVGVRIEQSQKKMDQIQYKSFAGSRHLKASSYKLAVTTRKKRGVYTFCMCPGGYVVPSMHEENSLCVNGMSHYARDGENANSAVLVNISTADFGSDYPLAGIEFQRALEKKAFVLGGANYHAPVQLVSDYLNNVETLEIKSIIPTYKPGFKLANLNDLFPAFINDSLHEGFHLLNKRMPGFIDEETLITGVEARSSAPVRIVRDQHYEASIKGIYPIGEGAGYAGGIMSAAVDGIMCAEMILREEENGSY